MSPSKWDLRFISMAFEVGSWSKDPKRQVGCVIIAPSKRQVSVGYNGLPQGMPDDTDAMKDDAWRLANTVHAECNAIRNAPFKLDYATVYVTRFPCLDCARQLQAAGIGQLWAPCYDPEHRTWGQDWVRSAELLTQGNVQINYFNQKDD